MFRARRADARRREAAISPMFISQNCVHIGHEWAGVNMAMGRTKQRVTALTNTLMRSERLSANAATPTTGHQSRVSRLTSVLHNVKRMPGHGPDRAGSAPER